MTPEIERLIVEEDRAWSTLHAIFERVPPARFEEPHVTPGGWSAKDVMFHVGAWLAEASRQLERIREQAARISERTAFMLQGELIEYDDTRKVFTSPRQKLTEDYITGRFG